MPGKKIKLAKFSLYTVSMWILLRIFDLILLQFMTKNPAKRLGCVKSQGGEKPILVHHFFHEKIDCEIDLFSLQFMTKNPAKRLGCVKSQGGEKAILVYHFTSYFHFSLWQRILRSDSAVWSPRVGRRPSWSTISHLIFISVYDKESCKATRLCEVPGWGEGYLGPPFLSREDRLGGIGTMQSKTHHLNLKL